MKPLSRNCFLIVVTLLAVLVVSAGCRVSKAKTLEAVTTTPEEEAQAVASMKAFLSEVDRENGQTWDLLSPMLQASVSQTAWAAGINTMKMACGRNLSRKSMKFVCTDELSGAPKGRYFIFEIDSDFERLALTERVVLSLEDKQWKVAGYFRKKTVSFTHASSTP